MLLTIAIVVSFLFISGQAFSEPANHLNWGYKLNASETACPSGKQVLNVVRKVTNSLDSGTGMSTFGTVWWAYIDYVQQIQVVQTASNAFCATVKNQGSFESVGGDGPGCNNSGTCGNNELGPGVVGTFQGGGTMIITGALDAGGKRTKGSIEPINHGCNAATSEGCTSRGFSRWLDEYFPGASAEYSWWGWVYHAGNNGSWVNSISGNQGNITGF